MGGPPRLRVLQADLAVVQESFPVESQTSMADRYFLIAIAKRLAARGAFDYLEVGSYYGGTLAPFLRMPQCTRVVSIDARPEATPDERGFIAHFGIQVEAMLDALKAAGLPLDKLVTLDGDISRLEVPGRFDFVFIDGEHTDRAAFRDGLHASRCLRPDAVLAFHDSALTYKALQNLQTVFAFQELPYRFVKFQASAVSAFLFGECQTLLDDLPPGHIEQDLEAFYDQAETELLGANLNNRLQIGLKPKPPRSV